MGRLRNSRRRYKHATWNLDNHLIKIKYIKKTDLQYFIDSEFKAMK